YRLIDGGPMADEDPEGVAAFLSALHAFDATGTPVERPNWRAAFEGQCERFRRTVAPLLDVDERPRATRLFAEVDSLQGFTPALLHGDRGPDHLRRRQARTARVA